MKIVHAFTVAALLVGSTVAASAQTHVVRGHDMRSYSALAGSNSLTAAHPAGTPNSQLEEPAISPNGVPTLSDFAARR